MGRAKNQKVWFWNSYRASKKIDLLYLFNISETKKKISEPGVSSENWYPHVNFEYRTMCVILGGWDICKPKWDSETDTIILVMTLSGLSSARLASRCPYGPLIGPDNPWETSVGIFGPLRASQGMTRPVGSQLGHLKAILVLWGLLQVSMNIHLSILELHFV